MFAFFVLVSVVCARAHMCVSVRACAHMCVFVCAGAYVCACARVRANDVRTGNEKSSGIFHGTSAACSSPEGDDGPHINHLHLGKIHE